MIPYITISDIPWLPGNTFGLLVMAGCIIGLWWTIRQARQDQIPARHLVEAFIFIVIPAYLGSHILAIVFYHPGILLTDPLQIFKFNRGLSSIGGLLIAVLAFIIYIRQSGNISKWREFGDALMQGFIVGWIFGRLGCTLVHDHPGIFTNFFLAIQYPDGARHDLGFYEFLFTLIVLFPVSIYIHKKNLRASSQLIAFCVLYSVFRFPADYLRIADARYFNLTPAQYGCIALLMGAVLLISIYPKQQQEEYHLP